jgi:glutamyl-tRNA reductase
VEITCGKIVKNVLNDNPMTYGGNGLGRMRGMLNELVILHTRRVPGVGMKTFPMGLEWGTCLRQLQLCHANEYRLLRGGVDGETEVYQGESAYQFLLEVVCGLHSPIQGETEVMGQFREFCTQAPFPETMWGYYLRQMVHDLLTDAKRVRHLHLRNLGSQSYGSLAARYFRSVETVAVLGAGKLVREMLPWLMGKPVGRVEVTVFNRTRSTLDELQVAFPEIRIAQLEERVPVTQEGGGLIIAAPMGSAQIREWGERQGRGFVKTIDLRGESAEDPVYLPGEVLDLHQFFHLLEEERSRARHLTIRAREEIRTCADQHLRQMQCRPFGWEDLCA